MRRILFDRPTATRYRFHPVALARPIFDLRCGITSLADKWIDRQVERNTAFFVPPYMAEAYRRTTDQPVNETAWLRGDDLLLIDGRVKAPEFTLPAVGPSQVILDTDGEVLGARIAQADLGRLATDSLDALLDSAKMTLPAAVEPVATWNYPWELIAANPEQLTADFASLGRSGIEGIVEEPVAVRGSRKDIFIARNAVVHPMTVLDAEHGPIYLDEGAVVHPFTRIEGPCYVGKNSVLFGCKCRAGNSIGPMCRVGGEVENTILHGYSNKYHDGFLGHAYVGEWVNLGAMTTNSDLKNDYSENFGRPGRQDGRPHGRNQTRRADWRPRQNIDRHALQHRGLCRRDDDDRYGRQIAAEVHSVVCLLSSRRDDGRIRQGEALRRRASGHEPPRSRMDPGRRGPLGRGPRNQQRRIGDPLKSRMRIGYLIGTDEAGYGPNLGPLVISATVWESPDGIGGERLFEHVAPLIASRPAGRAAGNQSGDVAAWSWPTRKCFIRPSEACVCWNADFGRRADCWATARGRGATCGKRLPPKLSMRCRWFRGTPITTRRSRSSIPPDAASLISRSSAIAPCPLRDGLAAAGVRLVAVRSRAVFAHQFNESLDRHGLKSTLLSHETLALTARLIDALPPGPVSVVCDKHGGRNRYAELLAAHFPDQFIAIHGESRERSVYRFGPEERRIEFCFRTKAESCCLPRWPQWRRNISASWPCGRSMRFGAGTFPICVRRPGIRRTPSDFASILRTSSGDFEIPDRVLWRMR